MGTAARGVSAPAHVVDAIAIDVESVQQVVCTQSQVLDRHGADGATRGQYDDSFAHPLVVPSIQGHRHHRVGVGEATAQHRAPDTERLDQPGIHWLLAGTKAAFERIAHGQRALSQLGRPFAVARGNVRRRTCPGALGEYHRGVACLNGRVDRWPASKHTDDAPSVRIEFRDVGVTNSPRACHPDDRPTVKGRACRNRPSEGR